MYITQQDLHVFYQQVHQNVAKQLGIKDYEWKSADELVDEIQKTNSVVATTLQSFITAYESWFNVHKDIDNEGTAGHLTPEQNAMLMAAIEARDSARQKVIDELSKLSMP